MQEQQVRLSTFVKPLADFERSLANVAKAFPPAMMLLAPFQAAYEPVKKDLKAKGYAVPEQVPTPAEVVYYTMLNTEMGKIPPVPFAPGGSPALPFGFAGIVETGAGTTESKKEEVQTTGLIEAQIV